MQEALSALLELGLQLGVDALSNPAIVAPVVAFVLTKVPGPFRLLAQAVAGWLIEQARQALEDRIRKAAADAVDAQEQLGGSNPIKKAQAVAAVMSKTGATFEDADRAVEAQVLRAKVPTRSSESYRAEAEADFARVAEERLAKLLSGQSITP